MSDGDKPEKRPKAATNAKPSRRKKKGAAPAITKIPNLVPTSKCRLRLLKLERIKDFLLLEEEFIQNQELLRPREEHDEVCLG